MIRLVAVDLDDTLLDHSQQISPRAKQAVAAAMAKGVTVTVATGRMFSSALPYARQLAIDVPLITYNGAMIRNSLSGELLLHKPIPEAEAVEVLALCRESGWYIQVYLDEVLYVKERGPNAAFYEKISGITPVEAGAGLYDLKGTPTKMLLVAEPADMPAIQAKLESRFLGRLDFALSKPGFLEIVQAGVNKGRALATLAERLGVRQAEVMAIGDSANDLDMLAYAGWGVAMGNAVEKVRQAANAVTGANDADGVAEAIERYVLATSGSQSV